MSALFVQVWAMGGKSFGSSRVPPLITTTGLPGAGWEQTRVAQSAQKRLVLVRPLSPMSWLEWGWPVNVKSSALAQTEMPKALADVIRQSVQ